MKSNLKKSRDTSSIQPEQLKDQAENMLEEARMVIPGIQALFGFQLIAVFNQRFTELDAALKMLHLTSLGLVTIAIAFLMAPAAFHRLSEKHGVSEYFVNLSSRLIAFGMAPLAVAISLELYIVTVLACGLVWLAAVLTFLASAMFMVLWFAFPLRRRNRIGGRALSNFRSRQ